ncbi:MAG: hypothetical protein V8Q42_11075, partial [Anaerovoracaceae bacterium]
MIVLECEEKTCVNYDKPEYRLLCQICSRTSRINLSHLTHDSRSLKNCFLKNVSIVAYAIDIKPCIIDTTLKYDGCETQGCGNCRENVLAGGRSDRRVNRKEILEAAIKTV